MIKKFKHSIKALYIIALLCLVGCAEPGIVIKNGPAGPNTNDLIKANPNGLAADKENARHGADSLKPTVN